MPEEIAIFFCIILDILFLFLVKIIITTLTRSQTHAACTFTMEILPTSMKISFEPSFCLYHNILYEYMKVQRVYSVQNLFKVFSNLKYVELN